jgi:hypothetical protein
MIGWPAGEQCQSIGLQNLIKGHALHAGNVDNDHVGLSFWLVQVVLRLGAQAKEGKRIHETDLKMITSQRSSSSSFSTQTVSGCFSQSIFWEKHPFLN